MAMLTVRNIDDDLKTRFRIKATEHGYSMEEQVRRILRVALNPDRPTPAPGSGLGTRLHQQIKTPGGGAEIELPPRSAPRPPPGFNSDTA